MEILFETEVNHLGVLIGNQHSKRIVALSTSDVFVDRALIPAFWKTENINIDTGFQAHLYTRPNDVLVLRVPSNEYSVIEKVSIAIGQNHEIWDSLTDLQISSHESPIMLVSDLSPPTSLIFPHNFSWYQGSMPEAASSLFKKTEYSFLAFVFNSQVADMLGTDSQVGGELRNIAQTTSLLMDKNATVDIFQNNMVNFPSTYLFNENTSLTRELSHIPSSGLYVFKPSGGAAGIGLYCNGSLGANLEQICVHIDELKRIGSLPSRFQIQEFIPGIPYGVSAYFKENGEFEILEIHQQIINQIGKFTGGRWTPGIELEQKERVKNIYSKMSGIKQLNLAGLICLDFIDGKLIEVNPRVTASAPIAHILRMQDRFIQKFGNSFRINQIDLNTVLNIPFESIKNGFLHDLIEIIWDQNRVLCLPQGLNPYGVSRMIFINDDFEGTAQKEFINAIIP